MSTKVNEPMPACAAVPSHWTEYWSMTRKALLSTTDAAAGTARPTISRTVTGLDERTGLASARLPPTLHGCGQYHGRQGATLPSSAPRTLRA
jgi:hypothetical protein